MLGPKHSPRRLKGGLGLRDINEIESARLMRRSPQGRNPSFPAWMSLDRMGIENEEPGQKVTVY